MTTRRNFLKGAAASGIAFCGCGLLDAAHAQPKAPRLPVKVNGKRVLTVDIHAHCYFRDAINLMGSGVMTLVRRIAPSLPLYVGVSALVASALGLWWWAERDLTL